LVSGLITEDSAGTELSYKGNCKQQLRQSADKDTAYYQLPGGYRAAAAAVNLSRADKSNEVR
jgi:hypothetical protein